MAADDADASRDFAEVSSRARTRLSQAFDRCPRHLVPSFRLWHYPVAGPQVTWVVFHCRVDTPPGTAPVLRQVTWDRDADRERLVVRHTRRSALDPTISEAETELDEARLNGYARQVTKLSLPRHALGSPYIAERQREYGLEGFDVEGRDGRPVVRIEWDLPFPTELQPIAEWSARVRAWFTEVMP